MKKILVILLLLLPSIAYAQAWQKPVRGTLLNITHPLSRVLVFASLLNEGTGSKVYNMVYRDLSGTISSADWVPGGMFFDGSEEAVDFGDDARTQLTGDLTIFVIAKYTSLPNSTNTMLSMGSDGESEPSNYLGYLALTNGRAMRMFWEHGAGTNVLIDSAAIPVSTNETHSFAVTRMAAGTSSGTFYFDGAVWDTYSGETNPSGGSSTNLYMGASRFDVTWLEEWAGDIYCVFMWNRQLADAEIAWLHREAYAMFERRYSTGRFFAVVAPPAGWADDFNGVANANIGKINGVAIADIGAVNGQ